MENLDIHEANLPCGVVLRLTGSMSVRNVPELERALQRQTAARRPLVVIEMSGVTVAGSLSMGMLLRFSRAMKGWSGVVRLCNLRPEVSDSFRRARLHMVLPIVDSLDDALGPTMARGPLEEATRA